MINNVNLPSIPAKRYFTLSEACQLAALNPEQVAAWQQQKGVILGKGSAVLTRADVIKLRQLRYIISDYFSYDAFDESGNSAITADEMRIELGTLLQNIQNLLAK